MIAGIVKAIVGALTGNLGDKIVKVMLAREQAKTDTEKMRLDAELAYLQRRADVLIAEQGWQVTAWIRPLFAYPLIFWWSCVIADSIFHFPFDVAALPAPLDEWAGWIVTAYFLGRSGEKIAKAIKR